MTAAGVFRLGAGQLGPTQQSRVSCGAACLTVARMMIDSALTGWILHGRRGPGRGTDTRTPDERFAEQEREVLVRTNALQPPRGIGWQVPWPTALGTPPWGALAELEHGSSVPGTRYQVGMLRGLRGAMLRHSLEHVLGRLQPGAPALLYIGDATLPRHVVLLYLHDADPDPDLYDPGDGSVCPVPLGALERGAFRLSGWDRLWLAVYPRAQRRAAGAVTLPGWWPQRVLSGLPAGGLAHDRSG